MPKHCLLEYCQTTSSGISLLSPDEQCANHRSGIPCGACQHNYVATVSHWEGPNACHVATNKNTFIWLIFVFAVARIAPVALLLVCNSCGLLFYANVVSVSGLTNTQNCSIHPILLVFIACFNLDLEVGMNTYEKTWLHFAFPLYIHHTAHSCYSSV